MTVNPHREVAVAMRDIAKRSLDHHAPTHDYARIDRIGSGKLQATVHSTGEVLADDELVLSYSVRKFDKDNALAVGDTLCVRQMPNGDWLAYDVVTDRTIL
jgi:hypothetical protein